MHACDSLDHATRMHRCFHLLSVLLLHHNQLVHREIDANHLPPPAASRGWNDVERERWVASPQHVRMHLRRRRM